MGQYHINPETGNPNMCRAKKQCPFGGESLHYATQEEARQAYEAQIARSGVKALRGVKLSRAAKLLLALDRAQKDSVETYQLLRKSRKEGVRKSDDEAERLAYAKLERTHNDNIALRDSLSRKIEKELPWDNSDAPAFDDEETVSMSSDFYKADEPRLGYDNSWTTAGKRETKMYEVLDAASAAWIKRLSTAEIKAVVIYNRDASDYAKTMAGVEEATSPEAIKYFHSALAKAPRVEKPFMAYAGISPKRVTATRTQADSGLLDLTRVQSASANPAQVNGFMFESGEQDKDDSTVVEFKLERVASLSGFNVHKAEMELLVPPGKYKVLDRYNDVEYVWGNDDPEDTRRAFRTAATTYKVSLEE